MTNSSLVRSGKELKELVCLSREGTTLILDEVGTAPCFHTFCILISVLLCLYQFYSWYIYHDHEKDFGKSVSSAEYIEDVNNDSVIIIDGLTKVSSITVEIAVI